MLLKKAEDLERKVNAAFARNGKHQGWAMWHRAVVWKGDDESEADGDYSVQIVAPDSSWDGGPLRSWADFREWWRTAWKEA